MAKDLVFYTNPNSRGRMVRWMLEEVGAPYETKVIDYGPSMKSAEYLAINPMGKVPALTHGAAVVTECAAIIAYLADAFPDAGLAPAPADRAAYYRWLFFVAGPLEAAWVNKSMGFELPEGKGAMAGYGSFDAVIDTLEKAVSTDAYIAGDRFTAADVYAGAQIGFGFKFGGWPEKPALKAYFEKVSAREAYKKAEQLDDGLAQAPAR
ncbi:MAG: glutathione S-transferase family protein [Alphaproteobacteria bacterium]